MSESRSTSKKEYLLGKMFDGAGALYDFFETMREKRDVSAVEVAESLKGEYKLTGSQRDYLDGVVDRTLKAKGVVEYFERRFGVNSDGTFQDPQGLHSILFNNYIPKRLEARTFNFGVGFTQGVWRNKVAIGSKHNAYSEFDCLEVPLKKTVSRLERGVDTNCRALAFRIPVDSRIAKYAKMKKAGLSVEEKLCSTFCWGLDLTSEGVKNEIINHEVRHVIDEIIRRPRDSYFVETPAYLYGGNGREWYGVKIDIEEEWEVAKKKLEFAGKRVERNLGLGSDIPRVIIEHDKSFFERRKRELKRIEADAQGQYELFDRFVNRRLPVGCSLGGRSKKAVLSYLFSTMMRDKVFGRIAEVVTPRRKLGGLK